MDVEKNQLKPWQKQHWCIPKVGAEFVARMEDVLDLYEEDATRPDPCVPNRPACEDYEYARKGSCNIFLTLAPHLGWRHADVTERRTGLDVAQQLQALVDDHFPEATVIRLVLDNLNVHTTAVLYEAFPPEEVRRIARKLELHYTPKHGSWLNIDEMS